MKFSRAALALALALLGFTAVRAQAPVWPKTTPADITAGGIGVQLTGADYGNGTFVLAAYFGGTNAVPAVTPAVYTSPDGATWTKRTLPVTGARVGHPRFLNGRFYLGMDAATNANGVPTGANGAVLSSADGITWTAVTLTTALYGPGDFAYGNGSYVASANPVSGQATQVITSTDGTTWTPRTVAAGTSAGGVAFFNGKFYCTAAGLYSSADGITWVRVTTPASSTSPSGLAAGATTLRVNFSAFGNSTQMLSADGVTFTAASPGLPLQVGTARSLNGAFVAPAQASATSFNFDQAVASVDGRTWATIATTGNGQNDAVELAYGNGRYVFVGEFDTYSGTTSVSPGGSSGGGGGTTTPAPVISTQPAASQSVSIGGSVTFTVTATGTGVTYQWFFNGTAIAGATSASYTLGSATAGNAGNYTVTVTNAGGSVTSTAAVLTVGAASNTARLSNFSIRAGAGSDSQTLIVGVTVGGAGTSGSKPLLLRGVGPALIPFGVTNALADPLLTVFSGSSVIATNDDWNNDAQVIAQGAVLGAFALTPGSKDAALVGSVPTGGYTMQLTGKAGTTGVGLVELYDASASFTTATPRLINVSARTLVGTGSNILITGFVVVGSGTRQVLIRGIGPGLTGLGVAGALADPKLELYNGAGVKLDENDNWTSATAAAQTSVGAFALTPGSKDAVLIATLAPGVYTAQVSGVGSTTGVGLVEVYELP